jgi:hypothetical protein
MNLASELRVKLRSLLLTALIRAPSTASSSRPKRSSRPHSSTNWRKTDLNAPRLSRRKSAIVLKSGFSVRNSQMTSMLRRHSRLQPTARPHPIQIAIDGELKEIAWRVARPARRLGFDAQEARTRQIKPVNEGVDKTHRIVGPDIIIHRLRQQQKLVARESRNVSPARF